MDRWIERYDIYIKHVVLKIYQIVVCLPTMTSSSSHVFTHLRRRFCVTRGHDKQRVIDNSKSTQKEGTHRDPSKTEQRRPEMTRDHPSSSHVDPYGSGSKPGEPTGEPPRVSWERF